MAERVVTVIPAKTFARSSESNEKRVAAYARVSTASDEQMCSVAVQKDYFEQLIQQRPDWVLVGIYADEGISGTSLNRREAFNHISNNDFLDGCTILLPRRISRGVGRNRTGVPNLHGSVRIHCSLHRAVDDAIIQHCKSRCIIGCRQYNIIGISRSSQLAIIGNLQHLLSILRQTFSAVKIFPRDSSA